MIENVRLSFQGIWSHKMRSFLTMLGIIIGIASIISIVSTIQGTNEQIKKNLIGSGNNTVSVKLSQGEWDYEISYNGIPNGVPVISESTRQEILDLPEVENVALYTARTYADGVFYKNQSLQGANVYGIDAHYFDTAGYIVRTGRQFIESDYKEFRKVAIIDDTAATVLFQEENPLGKTIEINKEPFIVVGVAQQLQEFEPVINSIDDYYMYTTESSGTVYIPSASWCIVYQYDEPQNVLLKATSTEDMSSAGKQAEDILNKYVSADNSDIKYKAADVLQTARNLQELSNATNSQLIWIASISLLVGGIGVMNIMLVSVTERTSEIGLKKAIGAKKRRILGQFLTEAAVLTSLGGVIGVGVGIGLSEVINQISGTPIAISIPAAVGSVLFSMMIGIIFGLLPSIKAANLNPIDALRHE
ncbi:MAG: ABC transporter permease [Lachnospiraceae bacterium]|nr:ABC transporter permease [Robinsoniella sp.]MDY3767022.1 ABC transporter permease [Lachnospiraceae bacterium]